MATDHGAVQAFPDADHTVPKDKRFQGNLRGGAHLVDDLKGLSPTEGSVPDGGLCNVRLGITGFNLTRKDY